MNTIHLEELLELEILSESVKIEVVKLLKIGTFISNSSLCKKNNLLVYITSLFNTIFENYIGGVIIV